MVKRVIIIDTRERKPLSFTLQTSRGKMETGDYTLVGYSALITVEHKRWGDLIGCIATSSRWAKFQKTQLTRLQAFGYKMIIVTGAIDQPIHYSACKRDTIIKRITYIMAHFNIPVLFSSSEKLGAKCIENFLLHCAKEVDTNAT